MTDFLLVVVAIVFTALALIGGCFVALLILGWLDSEEEGAPHTQDGPWADDHR